MTKVFLLGAGKIGAAIVELLAREGDYALTVGDHDESNLQRIPDGRVERVRLDVEDGRALREAMAGHDVVVNACPHDLTRAVAEAARDSRVHYFDLTEDVASARRVRELAEGAETAFVPQCGLAPGFISIVAHDLCRRFETLQSVLLRVGALPQYSSNALKYNLTWSTDGLINEYCNPCEAIAGGKLREVPPLEEWEIFSLDGVTYEAFATSGGVGTLCETLAGRVETLNYKTVRYPGHRDAVKMLLQDLRLGERREILKDVLEQAIPITLQDVVVVFATVSGRKEGRLMQETYAKKIYGRDIRGRPWSAIQITTAAAVLAMVDLVREGKLPRKGFIKQEEARLADVVANRFGRHCAG